MFQIDWQDPSGRHELRIAAAEVAMASFEVLEATPGTDWIAITVDREQSPRGYRVVSSRGGPGEPARFRRSFAPVA